jgi:hypothetical protein
MAAVGVDTRRTDVASGSARVLAVLALLALVAIGAVAVQQQQTASANGNSASEWKGRADDLHHALHWTRQELLRARVRVTRAERKLRRSESAVERLEERRRVLASEKSRAQDITLWLSRQTRVLASQRAALAEIARALYLCRVRLDSAVQALGSSDRGAARRQAAGATEVCNAASATFDRIARSAG